MKSYKIRFFIISIFIPLSFIAEAGTDSNGDGLLDKFINSIPENWSGIREGNRFILERTGKILIVYENKINAPNRSDMENTKSRTAIGKKSTMKIIFKIEKKWNDERLSEIKKENNNIREMTAGLEQKYKIGNLYNKQLSRKGRAYFTGTTTEEKYSIRQYESEKKHLDGMMRKIPDYNSEKFSIFIESWPACTDEYHTVYPESACREFSQIKNLMVNYFKGDHDGQ
ncbi:MAG: hypothetical protein MUD12_05670 [Spirochaetes bacterium]|jgi:hypothetical protein|nr:hypothetical protein [Spirochaetota bacterium]